MEHLDILFDVSVFETKAEHYYREYTIAWKKGTTI
jgi:hypothetical protein